MRLGLGAVTLHLLLDHDGYLSCYTVITEGEDAWIQVAGKLKLQRGATPVFDRGYTDYSWFQQLTEEGVNFVTRPEGQCGLHRGRAPRRHRAGCPCGRNIVLQKQAQSETAPFLRRVCY